MPKLMSSRTGSRSTGVDLSPVEPTSPCPICAANAVRSYRPFCSKRCADIDLGRWLNGSYAVPTEQAPEFEEGAETMDQAGVADDTRH